MTRDRKAEAIRKSERIEREHRMLASLIERIGAVCHNNADRNPGCEKCPAEMLKNCRSRLLALVMELQKFLLNHIHDEDTLMDKLPGTPAAREHGGSHRFEHVRFTTRFNHAVAGMKCVDIRAEATAIESIVIDWTQSHALKFDHALASFACGNQGSASHWS